MEETQGAQNTQGSAHGGSSIQELQGRAVQAFAPLRFIDDSGHRRRGVISDWSPPVLHGGTGALKQTFPHGREKASSQKSGRGKHKTPAWGRDLSTYSHLKVTVRPRQTSQRLLCRRSWGPSLPSSKTEVRQLSVCPKPKQKKKEMK